jgi:hypothetical protein
MAYRHVHVHLQEEHVGLYGQWIDSWTLKPREVTLYLEDDLDLSPHAWTWLKAYKKYHHEPGVMGFSLRGNIISARPSSERCMLPQNYGTNYHLTLEIPKKLNK